ncbi:MAG TPA: autotransporter-associated beta strand repeat-containing protein, partial [Gemmataceae bacterium]
MKSSGTASPATAARRGGASRLRILLAALAAGALPGVAAAQSGTWTQSVAGSYNWGDPANWSGGTVASGANNTANFTAGLGGAVGVNLDTARTIGALVFDNQGTGFSYTIGGTNALTLSNTTAPTITVNTGTTAVMAAPLAGTQGFTLSGPGTLALTNPANTLTGAITLAGAKLQLGAGVGYNQKVVVGATSTFANSGITATMDGGTTLGGNTWYEVGQNPGAPTSGLPMGTTFTSATNTQYQYALQTSANRNALLLDAANPTGRLVLSTPTAMSSLSLLVSSGNGAGTLNATVHYADGTPDFTGTVTAPDWFNNTANVALIAFGRISAGGYDNQAAITTPGNPRLYDGIITGLDAAHPVGSIDLSWTGGATTHTVIMGAGGANGATPVTVPLVTNEAALNYTNAVAVTADSTIDVKTLSGATLGNLTIGTNTLTTTASFGPTTLGMGAVTLTGNPTFAPAAGMTTSVGALSDGGTARTITASGTGTGTVNFTGAAPGLSANTAVVVNSGTLGFNNATAFGPAPTVTVNGGTLSLGASPTVSSLTGTGSVALNGNTLTIAHPADLTFAGTIRDGTAPGAVVKNNATTLTLTGASTFTGGLTVNAGKVLSVPGSLGRGVVNLAGGNLVVAPTPSPSITVTGFGGTGTGWTLNNEAVLSGNPPSITGDVATLVSSTNNQTRSLWYNTQVPTGFSFTASFTWQVTGGSAGNPADGFSFAMQNNAAGLTSLGGGGGSLGLIGLANSAGLGTSVYSGNPAGGRGLAPILNGALQGNYAPPGTVALIGPSGNSNNPLNYTLNYDAGQSTLKVTVADPTAGTTFTNTYSGFNFQAATGSTNAYLGFTAATGGLNYTGTIGNFNFAYTTVAPVYQNGVNVAATNSTLFYAGTAALPTVTFTGGLSAAAGGVTLNVSPDATAEANAPYNVVFQGAGTINGPLTLNINPNGTGAATLTIGTLVKGTGNGAITKNGGDLTITGGGTLGGPLTINNGLVAVQGSLSVGSLVGGAGTTVYNNSNNNITLTVGSDNTSTTFGGLLADKASGSTATGTVALTKVGTGSLTLTNTPNTYSGGTNILGGILSVANDTSLGTGPVTIGPLGTLSYSASTSTNKTFVLGGGTLAVGAGQTLTLNGSQISNGYLGGAGTFATGTGGAQFANVTTLPSVTVASNSGSDQFV